MRTIQSGTSRLVEFFLELVHRSVVRVTVMFASSAVGAVMFLHFLFQHFEYPAWYTTVAIVVAAVGLLVTTALAWIYDITPKGIVRTGSPAVSAAAMPVAAERGPIRSIAVLPFADLSPANDQEYFSDGITEELLNVLARIEGVRVPARTSSFAFKGRNTDIREIARTLGVEAVLEGSVRRWENELVITAQLIDAADGCHLWSERYRRQLKDVFALQEEISAAIVGALRLRLGPGYVLPRVSPTTSSPNAYTLYLKGRYFYRRGSEDGLRKAITFFTAALRQDPTFAAAYAGLGEANMNLGYYGYLPREKAYRRAKRTVARALQLDPNLAEAHAAAAWIALKADWDFTAAEAAYRRALTLDPHHSPAHLGYALYLAYRGRLEEALAEARRAVELDPLSLAASNTLAVVYMYLGRSEQAIRQFHTSLELDPGRHTLLCNLALSHAFGGELEPALALAKQAHELSGGNVWAQSALGYVAALAGDHDTAGRMLTALDAPVRAGEVSACFAAVIHVALGEHDRAFELLELAFSRRDDLLLVLDVDPIYAPLRPDPRFAELARRVGLGGIENRELRSLKYAGGRES